MQKQTIQLKDINNTIIFISATDDREKVKALYKKVVEVGPVKFPNRKRKHFNQAV